MVPVAESLITRCRTEPKRAYPELLIDGENLNGANDPDNGNTTPADYNNLCTTAANGQCSGSVPASETQPGSNTALCFWADLDNDTDSNGGTAADGSGCAEGAAVSDSDETDVVLVSWLAPGTATDIACTPRSDQNVVGASHTVTCTVTDPFGAPSVGALVDFTVVGRNAVAMGPNSSDRLQRCRFLHLHGHRDSAGAGGARGRDHRGLGQW